MTMITFTQADMRFIYRIVGVAIEDGRVLLHKAEDDDFWALPGGRGELLEPAAATLRREMREELGIEVEVVRLLWLVENFFQGDKPWTECTRWSWCVRFKWARSIAGSCRVFTYSSASSTASFADKHDPARQPGEMIRS